MLKFSKTGKTASQEQLHNTKMSSQRLEQDMGSLSLSDKSRLPPTTAPAFYGSGKKFAPVVAPKPKKSQVQAAYQAQKTTEYSPSGAGARTQENYASYYSTTRLYIDEGTEDDLPPPPPPAFEGAQPTRYDDDDFPPPPPPQEMTSYSSEPLPPPPNVADESFPPPPPETSYSKRSNGYAVTRPQEQYNPSPTNLPSSSYSPSPAQTYSPQPSRTYTPPASTRSYSPTTPSQSSYNPPRTYTSPQSNYTPSNTYNSYSPTSTYSSSSSSYSTPGSYNRSPEKSTSQPYTPQQPRVNVTASPSYSSPNSNIPAFNVSVNSPAANPASPQPQRSGGVTLTKSPEEELDVLTKCLVDKMENPETDFFGICGNCGQKVIVDEEGCSAMDKVFHVKCFTCTTCGAKLHGKSFYAVEGQPTCEDCYINSLEKCSVCSKPIMERILRATGKPYHPACFTCVVCGKSLDGIPFTVDATNQIHCIEDFHKKFAPRCSVCHEPIMPEPGQEETIRIVAMDRSFHVGCYKCEDCGMVLSSEADGRGCYPLDDHILCRDCNAKRIQALSARISTEL